MNKKVLLSLISVLFLLAGVATGVILVRQQQLSDKKASTPDGLIEARLSPETHSVPVGGEFDVNVLVNTNGVSISGTTLVLNYTYDSNETSPPIRAINITPNQSLINDTNLRYQIDSIEAANGLVTIVIGLIDVGTTGYANTTFVNFGTINFLATRDGTINLTFNPSDSEVITTGNQDQLLTPSSSGVFVSGSGAAVPTATPTQATVEPTTAPSPTQSSVQPSATPIATNTPSPSNTPAPSVTPGGPSVTPNPTPTPNNAPAAISVKLISPYNGQAVTVKRPVISGTAGPNATVAIEIRSAPVITGSVTADTQGNWSWTPTQDLASGNHTITVTATDAQGRTSTAGVTFSVTLSATSGSDGATEAAPQPSTTAQTLPQAGSMSYTYLMLMAGAVALLAGLAFLKIR